jgi:hypothetical protein
MRLRREIKMDNTYKNRFELKYVLDYSTYLKIRKELDVFFKKDSSGDEQGKYEVTSLYYDTKNLRFFWEKIDGEKKRVKVRLRKYDSIRNSKKKKKDYKENQKISLELKKRDNKNVSKKRAFMDEGKARLFIESLQTNKELIKQANAKEREALCETSYLKNLFQLHPTVIVSYIREALISKDGLPLRITFDSQIKYRTNDLILERKQSDRYVIHPRNIIMEIKYSEFFPVWLIHILQRNECQLRTFSKYCTAMEHHLSTRRDVAY